jgi:hypothetical protein
MKGSVKPVLSAAKLCIGGLRSGHALAQLVEVLRYKTKGRGFDWGAQWRSG